LIEYILQVVQQAIYRSVLDPTLGTDMRDPRFSVELGDCVHIWRQMRKVAAVRHYQNSTPLVALSPGMGTFASKSSSGADGVVFGLTLAPTVRVSASIPRTTARRAALLQP
jgi:hypothetical protein